MTLPEPAFCFRQRYPTSMLAFSPTDSLVAVAGNRFRRAALASVIDVWDLAAHSIRASVEHPGQPSDIVYSPAGDCLVSQSTNTMLWDTDTYKRTTDIRISEVPSVSCAFSPNRKAFAIGFFDGKVAFLNAINLIPTKRKVLEPYKSLQVKSGEFSLEFSPDSRHLAITHFPDVGNMVSIYGTDQLTVEKTIRSSRTRQISGGFFSCDSRSYYTVDDRQLVAWDLNGPKKQIVIADLPESLSCQASIPKRGLFVGRCNEVLIGRDKKRKKFRSILSIFDLKSGNEILSFEGHQDMILSVASSSDGRIIASATASQVKIWDVQTLLSIAEG